MVDHTYWVEKMLGLPREEFCFYALELIIVQLQKLSVRPEGVAGTGGPKKKPFRGFILFLTKLRSGTDPASVSKTFSCCSQDAPRSEANLPEARNVPGHGPPGRPAGEAQRGWEDGQIRSLQVVTRS